MYHVLIAPYEKIRKFQCIFCTGILFHCDISVKRRERYVYSDTQF